MNHSSIYFMPCISLQIYMYSIGKKVEGNEDDIPSSAVDLQVKERVCLTMKVTFMNYNENYMNYNENYAHFLQMTGIAILSIFLYFQFLKKVQRQERVIEEVKLSLKPFYNKKTIGKDDYKEIMRKCVQKVIFKWHFFVLL